MRTSETHPLRVDFISSAAHPRLNNLGMTFAPGKKQKYASTGIWHRDLVSDLKRLREFHRVDTLVSLVEEHELEQLQIPDRVRECARQGIEIVRFPIADQAVPAANDLFLALVGGIVADLAAGKKVVIHCKGGLGRAGTVAACSVLAATESGLTPVEAVALVRRARHGTIENVLQEKFIESFAGFWH